MKSFLRLSLAEAEKQERFKLHSYIDRLHRLEEMNLYEMKKANPSNPFKPHDLNPEEKGVVVQSLCQLHGITESDLEVSSSNITGKTDEQLEAYWLASEVIARVGTKLNYSRWRCRGSMITCIKL